MGSTLLIATILDDQLVSAHVGDSRLYCYQDGKLSRLTRDHTVMDACIEAGVVTEHEARLLGFRGSLTRGLACSDGLTDMLDDSTIARVLTRTSANDEAVRELIAEAKQAGGWENISVILATVS